MKPWFVSLFTAALVCAIGESRAEETAPRIILHTAPILPGEVFPCRIPVRVESVGEDELRQFDIIARLYADGRELASTGLASGDRPLLGQRVPGGWSYSTVPVQFDLTEDLCHHADSLRIVFARCVYERRPAEDCLKRIEFARAPDHDALLLPLAPQTGDAGSGN